MAAKQYRSPDAHSVAGTKAEPGINWSQCRRQYEAGATLRDLCAETGINSTSNMKRLLERAGCTMDEIAVAAGFKSRGAVHRILNRGQA